MRRVVFVLLFIVSQTVFSQSEFTFTENGITPKQISVKINEASKTQLYAQTLSWIQKNFKKSDEVITDQVENQSITILDVKPNYINIKKDYYYVKYSVKILFEDGQFTFEPLEVFTKLNSKYDMGWQKFDLKDGSSFFKRGKPIKSTKVYVKKIPSLFNDVISSLSKELN